MDGGMNAGNLPWDLWLRLQMGREIDSSRGLDIESLRFFLKSDPRTEVMILRLIEFAVDEEELEDWWNGDLVSLLIDEKQASGAVGLLLRWGACRPLGKRCCTTLQALKLIGPLEGGEALRSWVYFKSVGGYHHDLYVGKEDVGRETSYEAFDWLYSESFDRPDLIPLLFADGKRSNRRRKELLTVLASQTQFPLEEYDLGELQLPLEELMKAVEGIADPRERAEHCSRVLEGEAKLSIAPDADLPEEKLAELKQIAMTGERPEYWEAMKALSQRAHKVPALNKWLKGVLATHGERTLDWTLAIAQFSEDLELGLHAVSSALEMPESHRHLPYCLRRLCGGSSRLPYAIAMPVIQRAIDLCGRMEGSDRTGTRLLWSLLIEEYGREMADFSDLLSQIQDRRFTGWEASGFLQLLYSHDLHREEVRKIVEQYFKDIPEQDIGPQRKWMAPSMLVEVESSSAFEVLLGLVGSAADQNVRVEAIKVLMLHFGENPKLAEALLMWTDSSDPLLSSHARRAMNILFPRDPRFTDSVQGTVQGWRLGFQELSPGFDAGDFQRWLEDSEARRQRLISGLTEGTEHHRRIACAYSLAYWFGDHPGTLPFLLDYIRALPPDCAPATDSESWRARSAWEQETELRHYCMKILCYRWPREADVRNLAVWALQHSVPPIAGEAARFLGREYGSAPETIELLSRHLATNDVAFEEYVTLLRSDLGGMKKALQILDSLEACPEQGRPPVACYGASVLARVYGPRKDLKRGLQEIALRTPNETLRSSIERLFEQKW